MNRKKGFLVGSLFLLIAAHCFGQLEKVIIEKYYVSDVIDATDTLGGSVPQGSITYRIYVDMYPDSKLKKIYGDANHPFMIKSTAPFYNHNADGQTFAKDFVKARYGEGVLALDTWLTLGATTKTQSGKTHFGILKNQDTDGSFIGGVNNDGGTGAISGGLLTNDDPSSGIPLTLADGMDTMANVPSGWFSAGITDFVTGADTTIFGSVQVGNEFFSNGFELRNSGVSGVIPDSNQVLIAQLTTTGELTFTLNMEITALINGVEEIFKYVGSDSILLAGETYNPFMIYPLECGCNDPTYLEFDPTVGCLQQGACVTSLVMGCMDSMACNFDAQANFNVQGLCCYPGLCNGRDIAEVCPVLLGESFEMDVYPNPSNDDFTMNIYSGMADQSIQYELFTAYGLSVLQKSLPAAEKVIGETLEVTHLENGLYHLKVRIGDKVKTRILVKSN